MSSSTVKCSSCNIVICEVLAFIQNKQDVMDEETLVRLCLSSFTAQDIESAKQLLFDSVSQRKKSRRKANKSFKDLHDVIALFKESLPEDLPIFVAKDLQKLPPLTFDHIDATRLLKDMIVMKSELQHIKDTYVTQSQLMDAKTELTHLKNASIVSGPHFDYVNKRRGGGLQNSFCLNSGPFGLPHIPTTSADRSTNLHQPSHSHSCVQAGSPQLRHNSTKCNDSAQIDDAHSVCLQSQVKENSIDSVHFSTPTPTPAKPKTMSEILASEGEWKEEERPEEWKIMQRKRLKNRFVSVQGKAAPEPTGKFKAADIKIPLFINNVDVRTSEDDDIKEYILSKSQVSVDLRKVKSKEQKQYNAYIVYVPKTKLSLFLDDGLWPEGVAFRRFVDFKRVPKKGSEEIAANKPK
ncbi:hypothetical protein NE865_11710 [Phthorimaea operculella]|nr:hypothetical protein NE865_11710 [Phthorimaea operculella]